MGVEVEVRDTGANRVTVASSGLSQAMFFGVLEDAEPYPDGTPVAEVGAVHEFGAGPVPQRSFLRAFVDGGGAKQIGDAGETSIGKVVDGASPAIVSEAMGAVAVMAVKKRIDGGIDPALAESTKANPARDSRHIPLFDTGHLRDSIDHREVGS